MTIRIGSLCTGFSGLDHAISDVLGPTELVFVADPGSKLDDQRWDFGPPTLLAHHYPDVPNLGDISAVDWAEIAGTHPVDLLAMGFPCTDVSLAGKQEGILPGNRSGVWNHCVTAIRALRPSLVVIENVGGLLSARAHSELEPCPWCVGDGPGGAGRIVLRALGCVLGDLADLGFDAQWCSVRASDVGAPHGRKRIFIIGWPADAKSDTGRLIHGNLSAAADAHGGGQRPNLGHLCAEQPDLEWGGQNGLSLLPTPAARLSSKRGMPSADTAHDRMYEQGRRNLEDALALLPTPKSSDGKRGDSAAERLRKSPSLTAVGGLLPTPDATHGRKTTRTGPLLAGIVDLLPTPRATDGTNGGPNQRGSSGDLMLPSAVALLPTPVAAEADGSGKRNNRGEPKLSGIDLLLPTPTVADSRGTRNATAGRKDGSEHHDGWTLSDVAYAGRWGRYTPAIERWEAVIGRPAPDPTAPSRTGNPQLNPAFVEWLMGCAEGWVTDVPGLTRNQQLRLLGNGVVARQGSYAIRHLLVAAGLLGGAA